MTAHAAWRAFVLVALGIFLRSIGHRKTNFTFEDTLTQIGLGYVFLFVLGLRPVREQWIALVVDPGRLLGGVRALPGPGPDFDYPDVGVTADWPHLMSGFAAHWNKNSNLAWAFDTWFLNLFPRDRAVPGQRRRLRDAELHPDAGDDDPGPDRRRVLKRERTGSVKFLWLLVAGPWAWAGLGPGRAGHLPGREADLDAELGPLQRRLLLPVPGGLLRGHRRPRLGVLVVSRCGSSA